MRIIRVHKAQPAGYQTIENVQIEIGFSCFPDDESPAEARKLHELSAGLIADAMISSLPGGTLDALTVRLLQNKVSQLIVPTFGAPKPERATAPVTTPERHLAAAIQCPLCGRADVHVINGSDGIMLEIHNFPAITYSDGRAFAVRCPASLTVIKESSL